MSKAKAKSKRRANDAYMTPPELARFLVSITDIPHRSEGGVLEPSAGTGAFIHPLVIAGAGVSWCEIDETMVAKTKERWPMTARCGADFLLHQYDYALTLGNPPFSLAEEFVRHALTLSPRVAFLLRLAFLESSKRIPFWSSYPAKRISVLSERVSFTGGGSDPTAYAWFEWERGHTGPTELRVVSWRS